MDKISYKVADFEGPLDLLLFLVQKNKLKITDIPISELFDQYMAAIREWQDQDLDVATEFLEMAARLVQIKSAMLLPKYEQEGDMLRKELTGELIEYQMCQKVASRLSGQYVGGDLYVRQPLELDFDQTYRRKHPVEDVYQAYLSAVGRGRRKLPPPVKSFSGIVSHHIVSVATKIVYVLRRLYSGKTVPYHSLFIKAESKSELVATFLAVLELVKNRRICVDGDGNSQEVRMRDRTSLPANEEEILTEERAEPAWK